jgi:hypothetical protein
MIQHGYRIDGMDADFLYLSVKSFTGKEIYTVALDLRTMLLVCTCPDAECREKNDKVNILADSPILGCKHIQWAHGFIRRRANISA